MPNRHHAVNWTDGMKITKAHFVAQEQHLGARISEAIASQILPFSYGLLPANGGASNELRLDYKTTGEVEIMLRRFDAVTPGGYRITIDEDASANESFFSVATGDAADDRSALASTDAGDGGAYVVLSVNPDERLPTGAPLPAEVPPRHPHVRPGLRASLIPEAQFSPETAGAFFVVIGRMVRQGGGWVQDESFIPPCTAVRSHAALVRHYENLGLYINEIQQQALSIVQKIKSRSQQADLARNIQALCEEALAAVAQIYFLFRNVLHHQPPVHTVAAISGMANRLFNAVQVLTEKDKEEMLKYIAEWCDVPPSGLEQSLAGAIELRYEHTRIGTHMATIGEVMRLVASIFSRLNRLDYIGIRKENIVVREEVVAQTTRPKKGWSLLD